MNSLFYMQNPLTLLLLGMSLAVAAPKARLEFTKTVLASDLRGGYQVVAADMNRDGKVDLIALASGLTELHWLENPSWERHTIASDLRRMINVWPMDTDGDGIPELMVASAFENEASRSLGIVSVLHHRGDPTQPWEVREIDRLTTSHRIRTANGWFINAPLTGSNAKAPDYRDAVPLVAYRPGDWKRITLHELDSGVVHGIFVVDWDGDGKEDVMSASFQGIHVNLSRPGEQWKREKITGGSPESWPRSGTSDLAVGKMGKRRFLAAIEPWHGNVVAVYTKQGSGWERKIIDESLVDGHTIMTIDLNGDGRDEIVAGYRGGDRGVTIYRESGGNWSRQELSRGELSAAACTVLDWNLDRKPDLACIGSATANLILFTQK
jgi:hypothetical protein